MSVRSNFSIPFFITQCSWYQVIVENAEPNCLTVMGNTRLSEETVTKAAKKRVSHRCGIKFGFRVSVGSVIACLGGTIMWLLEGKVASFALLFDASKLYTVI